MQSVLLRSLSVAGLAFLAACQDQHSDVSGPTSDGQVPTITSSPSLTGGYSGTANAVLKTSFGYTKNYSCAVTATIGTQSGSSFSGTFAVVSSGDCGTFGSVGGTLTGTVQEDGSLVVTADTSDPGANIFEDAAARAGCTVVSTTGSLSGSFANGQWSASGSAVYDCPSDFGTIRVTADVTVSLAAA
jgi:hypothetical protein